MDRRRHDKSAHNQDNQTKQPTILKTVGKISGILFRADCTFKPSELFVQFPWILISDFAVNDTYVSSYISIFTKASFIRENIKYILSIYRVHVHVYFCNKINIIMQQLAKKRQTDD